MNTSNSNSSQPQWLKQASLQRLNMMVMNKKELLTGCISSFDKDIDPESISSSGLSKTEKYRIKQYYLGLLGGRQAMLALIECRNDQLNNENNSNSNSSSSSSNGKDKVFQSIRTNEFKMLSKSVNLPDEFLCDSGILYDLIFSKAPSSVVKDALQLLASVCMEKTARGLTSDQINLALKQIRVNALKNTSSTTSASASGCDDNRDDDDREGTSSKEVEIAGNNDENVAPYTSSPHNQATEAYRVQILTELIKLYIADIASISVVQASDDEEPELIDSTCNVDLSVIGSHLSTPLQAVLEEAEELTIDDLEASNMLLKPYLRQLSSLKAKLTVELTDLEESKAYIALGIDKDASDNAIKKAYHSAAVKLHPDKPGGDTKKFQQLQDLYQEVLQKRKEDDMVNTSSDPRVEAETKLATELVKTIQSLIEDLHEYANVCANIAQLSMLWQKGIDTAAALEFPKALKKLVKLVTKEQIYGNSKKKKCSSMHDCSPTLVMLPMENLCDVIQRISNFAMQIPSCSFRYGVAASKNGSFMQLVESAMQAGLSTMKCIVPLLTAEEQLKSSIKRLHDSKGSDNTNTHTLLVELISTAFRCCSTTISMAAEKAVASTVIAQDLLHAANDVIRLAEKEKKNDAKRAAAQRQQEDEYCEEDRAYMAARRKKEAEAFVAQMAKPPPVDEAEKQPSDDSVDQLRLQIRNLQVQLRVQHITALKSLNQETREMQRKLQHQLCDLVKQRESIPSRSVSVLPPVRTSLLSLLAEFIDGSVNTLRTECGTLTTGNAATAKQCISKYLGWLRIQHSKPLSKDTTVDNSSLDSGIAGGNDDDVEGQSQPPIININDIDIDTDSECKCFNAESDDIVNKVDESSTDSSNSSSSSSSGVNSQKAPETVAEEAVEGVTFALQVDFRTKALWMSCLIDAPAVAHMVSSELCDRLKDVFLDDADTNADALAVIDDFTTAILDGVHAVVTDINQN